MNSKTPAHMVVVKKEDKEAKVLALIRHALATLSRAGEATGPAPVLSLLVQSQASPVARAVITLKPELTAAGITSHIIIAKADGACDLIVTPNYAIRHLSDVRCHDAHEILVLGTSTAWVGDSLRREPATRDSYELHAVDCTATAASILTSFNRLWRAATAIEVAPESAAGEHPLAADLAALPVDANSQPLALTRH